MNIRRPEDPVESERPYSTDLPCLAPVVMPEKPPVDPEKDDNDAH
jgi:hypothetical protein